MRVYWDGGERTDVRREYHLAEDAAGNPMDAQIHDVGTSSWFLLDLDPDDAATGEAHGQGGPGAPEPASRRATLC